MFEKNFWEAPAVKAAIIGGIFVVVAAILVPPVQWLIAWVTSDKIVNINTLILLDRSAAMDATFDGKTKWAAAVTAVRRRLIASVAAKDNLALRQFGGPCDGDFSKMVVPFAQKNESNVRDALHVIRRGGETTLVGGIVEAMGDFNHQRSKDAKNSIIVITGGGDWCKANRPGELSARHKGTKIQIRIYPIAILPKTKQAEELEKIAKETDGRIFFPKSQEQLENVVSKALVLARRRVWIDRTEQQNGCKLGIDCPERQN